MTHFRKFQASRQCIRFRKRPYATGARGKALKLLRQGVETRPSVNFCPLHDEKSSGFLIGLAGAIWYGSGKTPAVWVGFAGIVLLMLAGALQMQQSIWKSQASEPPASPMTEASGGQGGDARVSGIGIAIGGPGGQGGKYGIGGVGGSAEVHGDGLAAGGAGGAAGEDRVWRAPAKSGYEIAQRKLGLPVDPILRQYL